MSEKDDEIRALRELVREHEATIRIKTALIAELVDALATAKSVESARIGRPDARPQPLIR
jgi:hypothetical protein